MVKSKTEQKIFKMRVELQSNQVQKEVSACQRDVGTK